MFWRDGLINPERVMEGYRPTCWPMFITCLPVAYRKVGGLMCLDIDSFAPNIQYSPAHQTMGGKGLESEFRKKHPNGDYYLLKDLNDGPVWHKIIRLAMGWLIYM